MSEEKTFDPLKSLMGVMGATAGYVTTIIAFVLALIGLAPGPYPLTTARLTFLVVSVLLFAWRWSQVTRHAPSPSATGQILTVGGGTAQRPFKVWDYLFDPFRKNSRRFYEMSLMRRRFETSALFFLLILASVMTFLSLCSMRAEILGLTTCSGSCTQASFVIVIAEFDETEDSFIENSLHDSLSDELDNDFFICRTPQIISLRKAAKEFAANTDVNAVVWGRKDQQIYEVNMEVGLDPSNVFGQRMSYQPTPEPGDYYFQDVEVSHLAYLTQFIISEALFETGDQEKALQNLRETLAHAELESLTSVDLAQGYFLQGFLYQSDFSPYSDAKKAIASYSRAIELDPELFVAVLNRGLAYATIGENEQAISDFTFLIENDSPYAADGYINRSGLFEGCDNPQKFADLQFAINLDQLDGSIAFGLADMECERYGEAAEYFRQAIDQLPDETFLYHLIGLARLYDGQLSDAKEAYCQMLPHLYDDDERQVYIDDFEELVLYEPELEGTIGEILKILRSDKCT